MIAEHATLGRYHLEAEGAREWIFTDNETNAARLFGATNTSPFVKDAFHDWLIGGRAEAVNPEHRGTKAAAVYAVELAPG